MLELVNLAASLTQRMIHTSSKELQQPQTLDTHPYCAGNAFNQMDARTLVENDLLKHQSKLRQLVEEIHVTPI